MNFSQDQFEHAQKNMSSDNLRNAQSRINGMTDEQLRQMGAASGQNIDPSMMRQAASMFQNMSPEQMEQMQKMAQGMNYNQFQSQQQQAQSQFQQQQQYNKPTTQSTSSASTNYSSSGPFSKVEKYKAKGNEHFKKSDFDQAASQYLEAIFEVEEIRMKSTYEKMSQNEKNQLNSLEIACRMNYANVKAKVNDFELVQVQAAEVLKIDKENPKGNFRMGQALFNLKKYQRALDYLKKAKKLLPNDQTVAQLLRDTQKETGVTETEEKEEPKKQEEQQQQQEKQEEKKPEPTKQEEQKKEEEVIIEEEKVEETKQQHTAPPQQPTFQQPPPTGQNANQAQQAKEMLKNSSPEQLEFMANQMKNMDNNLLRSMLKTQTGMDMTDEQLENYKNMMNPGTLKMMQNMNIPENMGQPGTAGGAAAAPGAGGMPQMPNFDPNNMDKTQAFEQFSKNPEMIDMAMKQMKENPELFKNLAKNMGPNNPMASYLEKASPEDMEKMMKTMQKLSPVITGGMKGFNFVKKNKYPCIAILVLIIAYFFF